MTTAHAPTLVRPHLTSAVLATLLTAVLLMAFGLMVVQAATGARRPAPAEPPAMYTVLPPPPMYTLLP